MYIIICAIAGMFLGGGLFGVSLLVTAGLQPVRPRADRRRARRVVGSSLSVLITAAVIASSGWYLSSLLLAASLLVGMFVTFTAMEWISYEVIISAK